MIALAWPQASTAERERLQTRVLQTLINDPELGQYPLAASVGGNRTVVLNGEVPTKSDRDTAARLVKSVAGVAGVTNEIKVNPRAAALAAPAAATPAGPAIPTNNAIHAVIQNAIAVQPDLNDVSVAVNYDEVNLTGTVPTKAAKKLAAQIAQADAGRRKIVNRLQVRKPRTRE